MSRQLATLLAARVASLRSARGWSVRTLRDRSGVATSTQNSIDRGTLPDMQTILKLAIAFEVTSLEEMFGPLLPTSEVFTAVGARRP